MPTRLSTEIQRLYQLPGEFPAVDEAWLRLVGESGQVRTLVVSLSRPADWAALSGMWRGVQVDLELPAPAIAVNGVDAYELWFSLLKPVSLAQAHAFLQGLRQRYLAEVKPHRVQLRPSLDAGVSSHVTPLVPAAQGDSGNWSAFVAPDLAAVFGDEPLLDLPPGMDAQADALRRVVCIKPAEFDAALLELSFAAPSDDPHVPVKTVIHVASRLPDDAVDAVAPRSQGLAGPYPNPRAFLLDVMNDASTPLALRMDAAKALLGRSGDEGTGVS
jgi:hypothetical protein